MSNTNHYDVIIIGTGAGGGTLAYKLAPSGKKILLLERGPYRLVRHPTYGGLFLGALGWALWVQGWLTLGWALLLLLLFDRKAALEEEAVLTSLRNLGSFPFVTDAVAAGLLTLHGAFVEIGTGALLFHRDGKGFVAV